MSVLVAIVEAESFCPRGRGPRPRDRASAGGIALENRPASACSLSTGRLACWRSPMKGVDFTRMLLPLLSGIDEAVSATAALRSPCRRLGVNVDAFFSRLLLAPYPVILWKLYPGLTLDIVAKDQLGDLISDGFDLAIGFGAPRIFAGRPKAVGDAHHHGGVSGYVKRHGRPKNPTGLRDPSCIQVRTVDGPADRRMAISARQQDATRQDVRPPDRG